MNRDPIIAEAEKRFGKNRGKEYGRQAEYYSFLEGAQFCEEQPLFAAAPKLLKELKHLVRYLEPLERDGGLNVPGLATLNGARAAIAEAEGNVNG